MKQYDLSVFDGGKILRLLVADKWLVLVCVLVFSFLGLFLGKTSSGNETARARLVRSQPSQLGGLIVLDELLTKDTPKDISEVLFDRLGWFLTSGSLSLNLANSEGVEFRAIVDKEKKLVNLEAFGAKGIGADSFLNLYIENANNVLAKKMLEDAIAIRSVEMAEQYSEAEAKTKEQIFVYERALRTAKAAGVKEYRSSAGSSGRDLSEDSNLFLLGEKYLQAHIDVLKKEKVVFSIGLQKISKEIERMTELKEKEKVGVMFTYLEKPTLSVYEGSRGFLTIVMSAILGLFVSIVFLIGKALVKKQ